MHRMDIVRLKPYQYIHLLNNNENITTMLIGPKTYTRKDSEYFLTSDPQPFLCVPPAHYCVIENPVLRTGAAAAGGAHKDPNNNNNDVVLDKYGQAKIQFGCREIRFAQDPFPLYPGETISQNVTPLDILAANEALVLFATDDTVDEKNQPRKAGDEWLQVGPCTYTPSVNITVVQRIQQKVVSVNQALQVQATKDFRDGRFNKDRLAGDEWLVEQPGAYFPNLGEQFGEILTAQVLTSRRAIHVRAKDTFKDRFNKDRVIGEAWLLTDKDAELFIPSPCEELLDTVSLTVVGSREYCIVENVVDAKGVPQLGKRELRTGPRQFFLHPGEVLLDGAVRNIVILGANEALLVRALRAFTDNGVERAAGSRWLIRGPCEYVPVVQVEIIERRKEIPLDKNEGVYIRNIQTGAIRAHVGSTVLLDECEELWEKELEPLVEELLQRPRLTKVLSGKNDNAAGATKRRNRSSVVTCNVPHNSLVQVDNFYDKTSRVVVGPDLVILGPHEEFKVISLSGGRPKEANQLKTLCLYMGPDFMADTIQIETSDHARLQLEISYNWEFDTSLPNIHQLAFSVPDFVGDCCKTIASRIRGHVAGVTFDQFHMDSSSIIHKAVLVDDTNPNAKYKQSLFFAMNGLRVFNVDVHSVDPVDPKTREALTKSVQLAIEITTKSQETQALHQATVAEQFAKGKQERQVIADRTSAETERAKLATIESENNAIESTGASKAQAAAVRDALLIDGQSEVDLAEKKSQALEVGSTAEVEIEKQRNSLELEHRSKLNDLEIRKYRTLTDVEVQKFQNIVKAVGKETILALAKAGPELQAKLLSGLGLQGYLITDGSNPINLFNTANGLTAAATNGMDLSR